MMKAFLLILLSISAYSQDSYEEYPVEPIEEHSEWEGREAVQEVYQEDHEAVRMPSSEEPPMDEHSY